MKPGAEIHQVFCLHSLCRSGGKVIHTIPENVKPLPSINITNPILLSVCQLVIWRHVPCWHFQKPSRVFDVEHPCWEDHFYVSSSPGWIFLSQYWKRLHFLFQSVVESSLPKLK